MGKNFEHIAIYVLIVFFMSGCNVGVIADDENKAIASANLFLETIMKNDYDSAYVQMSSQIKNHMSFEEFLNFFKTSEESLGGYEKAVFDSYQPVLKQRAIQLYYNVHHAKAGIVLYHLVLKGDKDTGYKMLIVDIGNKKPYPSDVIYVIKPPKLKKDTVIEVLPT